MLTKAFLSPTEIKERIDQEAASDKERKLTPEQIEAIYSNGSNILVSASAGSGKTFVMVERILDMIGRGVGIDQLFISTFTVKAAGELKERLEKRLTEQLGQVETDEERAFLSDQIAKIGTADIGTMDAFTQKLVNQYGYLLGVSPIFRIMTDPAEQTLMKNEVYADLFNDYMQGKDAQLFQKLVRNFAGNGKTSKAFRDLVYDVYNFSQATAGPEKWLRQNLLKGQVEANPDKAKAELLEGLKDGLLADFLDFLRDHIGLAQREFAKAKYLNNVSDAISLLEGALANDQTDMEDLLKKLLTLSGGTGLTNMTRPKDEELKAYKEAYNKTKNEFVAQLREVDTQLTVLEVLTKHNDDILPLLELLQAFVLDFSDQYLQAKIQENAFEFSDIAHFAIRILEENPEVAASYRDRYHEVMVDEYQDNSHTQERMLELLSNGHNRFMVGDIKQSIYRFRQADPQIFNGKFQLFLENPDVGKLILLKENFRSQSEVLDATNGVFSHLMDQEIGDILYDKTHMLVAGSDKQKEPHPENETEVLIYNSDEASVTPDEEGADQPISSGEISLVIKEIIKLHEQGVRFEDITLLAPTRNTYLDLMASFEEHGIPLVPDEYKSSYLESLEVMIMLDTLRAINNPLNDYALVALLRSPMFNFNEDDLARIAVQADKGQFYDKLLAAHTKSGLHPEVVTQGLEAKLTLFIETLSDWRDYSKWHSLYDLIWKIYDDRFYYDYVGSLPRAEQRQANLYALALRANAYEKTGFKGLSRFIGMIDKIISSGNDLEEVTDLVPKNAVSLMTIHKSKGLEFKYVFVLQMNRKFIGQSKDGLSGKYIINREKGLGIKYLADLKDQVNTNLPKLNVVLETLTFQENRREERRASISEEMRLLYVAMTRAEKKLYLVGKGSKEKLTQQFGTDVENNRLPVALRDQIATYQDWVMALDTAFMRKDLKFTVRFVEAEELTPEAIGQVEVQATVDADDLSNNRQTEDIKRALTVLESVEKLNQLYEPAIDLPSVRTPSQLKAFYEPVMDTEGVDIMDKKEEVQPLETSTSFELPDFGQKTKVTGAAVGSATHELMQRLSLSDKVTLQDLTQALSRVSADDQVKARLQLEKLLGFFDTELGELILANRDKLRREAPFAMLAEDPTSKEDFVVRGIIDGYLLLEDRIVLFDYKTDRFTQPGELKERYKGQMSLYAKALSQAYQIDKIDKYLILLGGQDLEVVEV